MRFVHGLPFLFLFMLHSSYGLAQTANCSGEICQARIEKLYVNASGDVYIGTSGDETKLNCAPVSKVYLTLTKSSPGFDTLYASLLAYQLTGDLVTLRVDASSSNCRVTYAVFEKK